MILLLDLARCAAAIPLIVLHELTEDAVGWLVGHDPLPRGYVSPTEAPEC